jgi:hypothetical protein
MLTGLLAAYLQIHIDIFFPGGTIHLQKDVAFSDLRSRMGDIPRR